MQESYCLYLNKICQLERVMEKTQFGDLIVTAVLAASLIAALELLQCMRVAQNVTSGKTNVSNMTGSDTTSSSSCVCLW